MDLRHLEYFVEVCREMNFTKASKRLHVSQPSISKTIENLETELDVCLFHRTSKFLELTEEGKLLLNRARDILTGVENLTMELNKITDLEKGKIRVGIPLVVGSGFLPGLIGSFSRKYPGIDVNLIEEGSISILNLLQDGSLDLGVICCAPDRTGIFEHLLLVKDPLKLVVSDNHSLSGKHTVGLADLKDEPFIMFRKDFSLNDQIVRECEINGFQPKIVCESSQRDFITELVAFGMAVTLLPGKVCQQLDSKKFNVLTLEENRLFLELSLVWKGDRYLSHAARAWLHFVSDSFQETSS